MRRLIQAFYSKLRQRGLMQSFLSIFQWGVCFLIPQSWIHKLMRKRHAHLSSQFDQDFASTVAYGPFKSLRFSADSSWSREDRAAMLLGLYEKEILEELQCCAGRNQLFVDLGAADGYYGVGVLVAKMFDRSHCFEISQDGQRVIMSNAKLNGVADQIVVDGIASKEFYNSFKSEELSSCVILVDIEGAEFDLFDTQMFSHLAKAIVIIEIHDFLVEDGALKLQRLKSAGSGTHHIREIVTGSRDLSKFPELKGLNDYDRWLICSERRKQLPTWLRFDPIK